MKDFFKNQKLRLIIISTAIFLFLTVVLIVVACVNARSDTPEIPDSADVFAEVEIPAQSTTGADTQATEQSENDYFVFQDNSSGCTLISVNNYPEKELDVPRYSPSGKLVTEIGASAFNTCDKLETINIHADIKKIGSGCFVGCSSLVAINVVTGNTKYSSVGGVLFSKDRTELLCYPSAKIGKTYLLSTNVKKIGPYAFDGVVNLSAILYEGSIAKYQAIEIAAGNRIFSSLPVTCNYVAAK